MSTPGDFAHLELSDARHDVKHMNDRIAFKESEDAQAEIVSTEYFAPRRDASGRCWDWKNSDWLDEWLKMARDRQSTNSN